MKSKKQSILKKPWLWLPPAWSHYMSPSALRFYSKIQANRKPFEWQSFQWKGISFPNPLGTAGGMDKNVLNVRDWWALGAGFCEAGTITPKSQNQNPGKVLERNIKEKSLWNSLGFPNRGLPFAVKQLQALPPPGKRPAPLFVNIGKNRDTPFDRAFKDYQTCIKALSPYAEAFVVNISSPNTKGLREFFDKKNLPSFLNSLQSVNDTKKPLILKLSPDLTDSDFLQVIEQSLENEINGWCICNSTAFRSSEQSHPSHGGVSGRPLKTKSIHLLKLLTAYLKKREEEEKLIVSTGGVLSPEEALERLALGAHLVQVYSALIFTGPDFFRKTFSAVNQNEKIEP